VTFHAFTRGTEKNVKILPGTFADPKWTNFQQG